MKFKCRVIYDGELAYECEVDAHHSMAAAEEAAERFNSDDYPMCDNQDDDALVMVVPEGEEFTAESEVFSVSIDVSPSYFADEVEGDEKQKHVAMFLEEES